MKPTITHDEWYELCNQLSEAQEKLAGKDAYIEGQNDSFAIMMEGRTELQKQLSEANTRNAMLVVLLTRCRNETPLGNQPYMIADKVDMLLAANKGKE